MMERIPGRAEKVETVFKGKLFAVEKYGDKGFERAVRPPGVRLILKNEKGEILLTKEFRSEHGRHDFRLPGGKVFDDIDSYLSVRDNPEALSEAVMRAGKTEARQEAGASEIQDLTFLSKSVAGASVEWDLYYLTGEIEAVGEQELEGDEQEHGIDVGFYSKDEVLAMLKAGDISEDRSASMLFKQLSA